MSVAGGRARRTVLLAAALPVAVTIMAYAGLLRRARWQGDEYIVFAFQREGGWHFLVHWYLTWSPRLVSDLLYAAYGAAVLALHRPLAGTCMALLWAGLLAACLAPAWAQAERRAERQLAGLALFALFLAGHGVSEVFYWPSGGLSYLPTLAGLIWLFWCLALGVEERPVQAASALAITAGSSEVGVFLALCIAACLAGWDGLRGRPAPWWLLPGVALAVVDLALVLHGRVGTLERPGPTHAPLHHAGASLLAALPAFARALAVPDSEGDGVSAWVPSVAARLLVVLAARWAVGRDGRRSHGMLLGFAAGLLLASFATIASAYYQFGDLCCQRHDTMRACSITLALAALGGWSAWAMPPRLWPEAAPLTWAAAVLLLAVPRAGGLAADWRSAPQAVAARAASWASGSSAGPSMVLTNQPWGQVVQSDGLPAGHYAATDHPLAWWGHGIMEFFGKQALTILPPRAPTP